ncbi:hypothetical protein DBT_0247 [Dissulfuribacter thermophilus]|uniref:Uncharacterized protein n=1 Tax=Dissulfuribacter thermophilus TaxID=1156395 RepID=A0A1B9F942_9BACT|nr:hypothetical protein DBT_0247 [Dissulfuribacter thermophilus]
MYVVIPTIGVIMPTIPREMTKLPDNFKRNLDKKQSKHQYILKIL